jgi:hypothetical protein
LTLLFFLVAMVAFRSAAADSRLAWAWMEDGGVKDHAPCQAV